MFIRLSCDSEAYISRDFINLIQQFLFAVINNNNPYLYSAFILTQSAFKFINFLHKKLYVKSFTNEANLMFI